MKHIRTLIVAAALLSVPSISLAADAPVANISPSSDYSIVQGATANFTTNPTTDPVIATYPVGSSPGDIVFDSITNSMWVANVDASTLSKVNISDGSKVDYPIPMDSRPYGVPGHGYDTHIAFDPVTKSVWVSNYNYSLKVISKFDIYTGTRIDYPTSGYYPGDIVFDPITNSVWVIDETSSAVKKINIYNGQSVSYSLPSSPTGGRSIAFDPITQSVWVANNWSGTVSKVNINTGSRIDYVVGTSPSSIAFDSSTNSIWVAVASGVFHLVKKINIYDGTVVGSQQELNPVGIAFDSITNRVWIGTSDSSPTHPQKSISYLDVNTVTGGGYWIHSQYSTDVAFDPVTKSVWVTDNGGSAYTNGTVSKVDIFGNPITTYEWRDGDCTTGPLLSTTRNLITSALTPGAHTIYARVKDSLNQWSACEARTVTVIAAPTATILIPSGNISVSQGGSVSFSGSGATDPTMAIYPISVTGSYPTGIAFDSITNSIWIANQLAGTVSKVNITTGASIDYPMGLWPDSIALDSVTNSIWVANSGGSHSVSKVNPTTGSRVDYVIGDWSAHIMGVAFDSVTKSIWATNDSFTTGIVSKINPTTGSKVDYPVGLKPSGVAFDPVTNSIWVAIRSSNVVSKIDIITGTKVDYPVGSWPMAVAFDPVTKSIWVTNSTSGTVSKVNIYDGSKVDYAVGTNPLGIAFNPVTNSMWVSSFASEIVSSIDVTTGSKVDYRVNGQPYGIAFDPVTSSMWIAVNAPRTAVQMSADGNPITAYQWRDGNCTTGALLSSSSSFSTSTLALGTHTIYFRVKDSNNAWSACSSRTITITASTCTLPWGGTINSGQSVTAYQTPSVTYPATCASDPSQTRTCSGGTLSGSYTNQACTVDCANGGCDLAGNCKNGANNPPACSTCGTGLVWNSGTSSCVPPISASITVSASPSRVHSGDSSHISWTASDPSVASCSLTKNGAAWGTTVTSAGKTDPSIVTQSVYTATSCKDTGGNAVVIENATPASVIVNVVPKYSNF